LPNTSIEIKYREQVLTCLLDILLEQTACKRNLSNALSYALDEMFDNIWEHSKTEYGWFLAQYYRTKEYADICFLDNGITIKGTYDNKGIKTRNDARAIELALSGKSTKKEDRGLGLWTTEKLVTESPLKGEFLVLSGKGGYYKNKGRKILFNLSCYWQGTIILLRINKTREKIDYTQYIE
jgi:anti-sigma regulatory factor (Ser/Thr protein kinase)